jgi:hypothetical protein
MDARQEGQRGEDAHASAEDRWTGSERMFSDGWYGGGRVGSQPAHDSRTAHAEGIEDVDRFAQHAGNASSRATDQASGIQEIRVAHAEDRRVRRRTTCE